MYSMDKLSREKNRFYRVKKGETLKELSARFNIPAVVLIKDNKLLGEIRQGDMLLIGGYELSKYTAKHLESVDDICKKFKMPRGEFLSINGISYVYGGLEVFVKKIKS